jgi:hypothetical protein
MASTSEEAELAPSTAAGYKITEKKTLEEYTALDAKYTFHANICSPFQRRVS